MIGGSDLIIKKMQDFRKFLSPALTSLPVSAWVLDPSEKCGSKISTRSTFSLLVFPQTWTSSYHTDYFYFAQHTTNELKMSVAIIFVFPCDLLTATIVVHTQIISIAANWPPPTGFYILIGLAFFIRTPFKNFYNHPSPTLHLPIHLEFKWDRRF